MILVLFGATSAAAQELPELTQPVNDFANVIDPESERAMESLILSLQRATGDVVVVATVDTIAPFADIRELGLKLFENHGRGIGHKGKDNGVLVVLAVKERQVGIEVGYDLEQFITDGFAGQTIRQDMAQEFRQGRYGAGLLAGVSRLISRIAEGRNVTLQGVPRERRRDLQPVGGSGTTLLIGLFMAIIVLRVISGILSVAGIGTTRRRYHHRWGGSPWSGWHSGVGPFGGGGFGGRSGGGFGGGFGGFGGGRSGGGGAGASW